MNVLAASDDAPCARCDQPGPALRALDLANTKWLMFPGLQPAVAAGRRTPSALAVLDV